MVQHPLLIRSSTLILMVVSVLITTGFRIGEEPNVGAFPLVVPTISYGLEEERFKEVEEKIILGETILTSILKDLGVKRSVRKGLLAKAIRRLGEQPVFTGQLKLFYNDLGNALYVAGPISSHSFLCVDLIDQTLTFGDLEGIESEYASTKIFFIGDIDSTLAYTLLDTELQAHIHKTLTKEMPLDTAFHVGLINLIYTKKRDQTGAVVGYGDIEALRYRVKQNDRTSIRFTDGDLDVDGFFRSDGSPALQTWLQSPVPGARISSPYSMRRFHPILKRIKPHFGTDYAAPYGTPVLAVSDGVVIARRRTRSNGNYIKISHNDTYQSQYLHLKGFANGIKSGTRVTKGQVIGYVGSTGLADGPHVCFRFWKNDHQIDHRKERLPSSSELTGEALIAFRKKQQAIKHLLDTRA